MSTCKVSLIVPVYNVAAFLPGCLESLVAQTIDKQEIEVLLINDGSTDESPEICREYAARYPWMRPHSKENEGLSATRNCGIRQARGKYLMYLDSDDKFSPETMKNVTDFFDAHEDEVDLVAFPHRYYVNGKKVKDMHYRYQVLNKTGVYDLAQYPYLAQTNISVCAKNRGENNILFDTAKNFRHEDQKYSTDVLREKWKIGFCAAAEYQYNRDNGGSIVSTFFHAYYIFDSTTRWFEEMFAAYPERVPPYIQGLFLNDIQWKLRKDILFPYHYQGKDWDQAMDRIRALLRRVDTALLMGHPIMPRAQKLYWLRFAGAPLEAQVGPGGLCLTTDGCVVDVSETIPIVIRRQQITDGKLQLGGYLDTIYYTVAEDETPEIYAEEDGAMRQLEVFDSVQSLLHPMLRMGRIFGFRYEKPAAKLRELRFLVKIRGQLLPTQLQYQPFGGLKTPYTKIIQGGFEITRDRLCISLRKASWLQRRIRILKNTLPLLRHPRLTATRVAAALLDHPGKRIWLYYDLYSVETDNGYFQFQNDFSKKDGVKRYYVIDRAYPNRKKLFSWRQRRRLVKKGSWRHRFLYLCAEEILTAFFGSTPIYPFTSEREEIGYEDIFRFRVTYLQNGVLHAALHTSNHAERCRADRVVVSTPFEFENYRNRYAYREDQLICTGMARYDRIDRRHPPEKRILFAPSWRKYLTHQINPAHWDPIRHRIVESDYYKNFLTFLTDPRLHAVLETCDYTMDIKLHPILSGTPGLFEIDHPRIRVLTEEPPPENYKVFLTDFSSYVFDFVYLGRTIAYFLPDEVQFRAGMHHYRALDLPWDEAFGSIAFTAEDAVQQLLALAERNFEPEEIYLQRMEHFFFPLEHCAESLYQQMTGK
ncbi:MAG: CDP-glycerol:glycerophosphate glycerophosphotransferase [Oscillospiraceae bacterium]|jgi:glycosyltransferase involved in cell wall biosynthesis|nr:CDP-glycerol:glycerophosphate glycerophosphotransferase [Oscillospiraceae bacterium]